MKDNMKCQHVLSEDITYKEVVVIGNGPSGMVTSYMLAGNVPYLRTVPENLPIDDMLRARLANLPEGQSLYETDLIELAEGLEGRSQNPIPLLMDHLFRPCTDLGIEADPLIEWRYEDDKQIDHIVLGRGPPGGSWPTFPGSVRTLSPGAWLTLPPHAPRSAAPLSARAVAKYCLRYVRACNLQRYFRNNVIVTSVTRAPPRPEQCTEHCPLAANYCVTGYEKSTFRQFRYLCRRVVLASGSERANTLANVAPFALHSLAELERALQVVQALPPPHHPVLVVGSGVSAADCVCLSLRSGLRAAHVHRTPAASLAHIPPQSRTDLSQVYKMMCDGPSGSHQNYTPYPQHVIIDIQQESSLIDTRDIEDYNIGLKRVTLLNLLTKETTVLQVNIIAVFIGARPDLFFLQTNFSLNCIDVKPCQKCLEEKAKRKIEEKSIKNHWGYIKSVIGQMQICKSRYLNDTCICDDQYDTIIPYNSECQCEVNPYRDGLGFGVDQEKPVDSRNPIAVDKGTHELLNSPKGLYALGPLTADNFMRFIPGGALAIVAHIHKEKMTCHT